MLQPIHVTAIQFVETSDVTTTATITVEPNPAEYTQNPIHVRIQIFPAPPASEMFEQIIVTFTRPDGFIIENQNNSSMDGSHDFDIYLSMVGNWSISLNFTGQTFDNGVHYLPSENVTTFTRLPEVHPWDTSGFWTQKTELPVARSGLGVATVNGKIYAIGGSTATGFMPSIPGYAVLGNKDINKIVGTNTEYDPTQDVWTHKESMPTPRIVFATAVYQNKIYCIGGKTIEGYSGVNEVYDTETDTWETKASMPVPRGWLTANVVDGKIFVISDTSNEVYDPETDSWTTKTPPPKAVSLGGCASAIFDKKIYVIGGISDDQNYNLNQIYDTETDAWSFGASPPSSVGGGFAVTTTGEFAPKQIFLLGNTANLRQGEEQTFVRIYFPENDTWTFGADSSISRYNFGVTIINDTIYVIGGHTHNWISGNFAPVAINEQYTPLGYVPEFPSYFLLPLLITATVTTIILKQKMYKRHPTY